MCGRFVAKTIKRIVRPEGKGWTIRDLVIKFTDRFNIKPTRLTQLRSFLVLGFLLGRGRTHP